MSAYYNEIDPFAAAWLRELIKAGHIADGEVDERSIADVSPDDVRGFTQCHFFAGIGGWSYALRLAGWPDDRPVWTGSCPCQPFSSAGKGDGAADSRHLWPTWFRLIAECRPDVCFGEQVASADGLGWFDRVSTDLEAADYAVGAADLCAAGVGAFHIRQRLWFVADAQGWRGNGALQSSERPRLSEPVRTSPVGRMADSHGSRCGTGRTSEASDGRDSSRQQPSGLCDAGELANAEGEGRQRLSAKGWTEVSDGPRRSATSALDQPEHKRTGRAAGSEGRSECAPQGGWQDQGSRLLQAVHASAVDWRACDWLPCRDGKARPVEPGTFPLAHGLSARVGRLRGYGNAIVPAVAAAFIEAYLEATA